MRTLSTTCVLLSCMEVKIWESKNHIPSITQSASQHVRLRRHRFRFECAVLIMCVLVSESALCFLKVFWQLLNTWDYNRSLASHFWLANCNRTDPKSKKKKTFCHRSVMLHDSSAMLFIVTIAYCVYMALILSSTNYTTHYVFNHNTRSGLRLVGAIS